MPPPAPPRAWLAILLTIGFAGGIAHAERLPISRYAITEGLPHDRVYCLMRDSRGFLWLCTAEGLSRFDGHEFKTYDRTAGLPHALINDLLETRSRHLLGGKQRRRDRLPRPRHKQSKRRSIYADGGRQYTRQPAGERAARGRPRPDLGGNGRWRVRVAWGPASIDVRAGRPAARSTRKRRARVGRRRGQGGNDLDGHECRVEPSIPGWAARELPGTPHACRSGCLDPGDRRNRPRVGRARRWRRRVTPAIGRRHERPASMGGTCPRDDFGSSRHASSRETGLANRACRNGGARRGAVVHLSRIGGPQLDSSAALRLGRTRLGRHVVRVRLCLRSRWVSSVRHESQVDTRQGPGARRRHRRQCLGGDVRERRTEARS